MNKIKQLSKYIISQIAAGEVIYNPSSIIKELIENSIDANSTKIEVYIEKGGKQSICIIDNGQGIQKDDLINTVKQHYTSKMIDLNDIKTLGFRGEALFSISQSACLIIDTKTEKSDYGFSIESSIDKVSDIKIVPLNNGTKITVKDLFKLMPIRLKFLKSDLYEKKLIELLILRFAIFYHNISFKFISNNKIMFNHISTSKDERIYKILGDKFKNNSFYIKKNEFDLEIEGFFSTTGYNESNNFNQYIYINGRYIRDRNISYLINSLYKDYIPKGRYPSYVIFLSIPNEYIDLHVHPAKTEVRFNNFDKIKMLIKNAFFKLINKCDQSIKYNEKDFLKFFELHNFDNSDDKKKENSEIKNRDINNNIKIKENNQNVNNNYKKDIFDNQLQEFQDVSDQKIEHLDDSISNKIILKKHDNFAKEDGGFDLVFNKNFINSDKESKKNKDILKVNEINQDQFVQNNMYSFTDCEHEKNSDFESKNQKVIKLGKPIKQIFNTFIIAETNNELILIDQHAAHERIVYEEMKKSFNKGIFDIIKLLIPIEISCNHDLEQEDLAKCINLGFEVIKIKTNVYNVIGYPSFILKKSIKKIMVDILHELATNADKFSKSIIERTFADIACKSSIKAGDSLNIYEMNFLIKQMEQNPFAAQCNHGRPTYIKMSNTKLRKLFERT